jgi:hypothetical protein
LKTVTELTAAVADSDSLRRAALLASWRRDRSVATRRLWWRWSLWVATRFLLPLAVLLGGFKLWMDYVAPGPDSRLPGLVNSKVLDDLVPTNSDTQGATSKSAANPTAPPATETTPLAPTGAATPVTLRLDWPDSPASKAPNPPAPRKKPTGANRP